MADRPRGTVTFHFTDIEGSTSLWERDRQVMMAPVERHLLCSMRLSMAMGHPLQDRWGCHPGDLPHRSRSSGCRRSGQRCLLAEDWGEVETLPVRMAVHAEEAEPDARGFPRSLSSANRPFVPGARHDQRPTAVSQAKTLLVRHAELLATMDDGDGRLPDGGIYVVGNVIRQVDRRRSASDRRRGHRRPGHGRPARAGQYHHHFSQTLTRAVPAAQNAQLFAWLGALYPIWAGLTPEAIAVSTKIAIAELLLSGCTTTSDHTCGRTGPPRRPDRGGTRDGDPLPRRARLDVGWSIAGWLPPDHVVEDETAILRDCRQVIEAYHDASRYAMLRIVLAPARPSPSPRG